MKKRILIVSLLAILAMLPVGINAYEELNLAKESGTHQEEKNETIKVQAFANDRNVVVIGNVMGVTYNFCNEPKKEFCSDYQGILVVSGTDTGKIPEMLKTLDRALKTKDKVIIELTASEHYLGVREILDVKLVGAAI